MTKLPPDVVAEIAIDPEFNVHLIDAVACLLRPVDTAQLSQTLRALADDLDAVSRGRAPDAATLAVAPILHDWRLLAAPDGLRLAGVVEGHPILGVRAIRTSPVWILNPDQGWARTLSRFYRLVQTPSHAGEAGVLRH